MKPFEIKPGIFWVGAVDWGLRDFHGYIIPKGTTYNNYLIMDEHVTLVDTVKHDFSRDTIENIAAVVDPSKIENVVINHIETDHVSSLDKVMELSPKAKLYMTGKAEAGLARLFDTSRWDIRVVKSGDTLSTGHKTLRFIETPMIHWPDSMMTFVAEDNLLFSQDAFGQHIASAQRFDDEFAACASVAELEESVVDYYANILMPFGALIKKKIEDIGNLGVNIDMIAPDHGVIWRKDPDKVMRMYTDMATGKADLSVAIVYDTMWQSTEMMTYPIVQGITDEGVGCKVIKLRATPTSAAITEFWKARGTLVGSPTLNNGLLPSIAEFLYHLKGLRPKNRLMGAFGSFGWSGGAVRAMYEEFDKMELKTVQPGVACQYKPSKGDKEACYEYGRGFARQVKEYQGKF